MISQNSHKSYGISQNIAQVAPYGILPFNKRDALNLCKDNKMNQKDCLQCVLQISKGVQQLHNHRITHRDLKPENILLKTKYIPGKSLPIIKLADFGLSTQKIIMQTIAGTKQYIAPEQAKFHNYTNAVDVWSLGIILDEILHGTPFYSGEDNKQVFNKILKTPFKVRDENLRASIKDLLTCLLKKKPYERPIIAVIRATIQRILQQIANEMGNIQSTHQYTKNRKSSTQNPQITNEIKKFNIEQKNRIISTPAKQQQNISENKPFEINFLQQPKKIQKPVLSKDISPRNRRPIQQKQQILTKNLSGLNFKKQIKQGQKSLIESETKSTNEKESVIKIPSKIVKLQQKQQNKQPNININIKTQSGLKVSTHNNGNQNEKIMIFKNEKRKLIGSHIKKQQYKADIININKYIQNIYNNYKKISEIQIKLQKEHDFLPNAYLNSNPFNELINPNQNIKKFKKQYDFINYLSTTQDYEIRVYKGEKQLSIFKQICFEQLNEVRQKIRCGFFQQLDLFIDQYIEKVLK